MADVVAEYAAQEEWDAWVRRYEWHLDRLPPLLQQMREVVVPVGAARMDVPRVSGGGMKDSLPLRADAADDAQALWTLLCSYVIEVSKRIGETPGAGATHAAIAASASEAWRNSYVLVAWLLAEDRIDRIVEHHDLAALEDQLFSEIRKGGRVYGLAPFQGKRRRLCTVCGEHAVVAAWIDEGAGGVGVARCERCGNTERGRKRDDQSTPGEGTERPSHSGEGAAPGSGDRQDTCREGALLHGVQPRLHFAGAPGEEDHGSDPGGYCPKDSEGECDPCPHDPRGYPDSEDER
nr:hypothetical protein [Microbacterium bovistercoris]